MSIPVAKQHSVSVRTFLERSGEHLGLELVAGEKGLDKKIGEAAINRAGLALTGFFEHFANKRIQVLGLSESTYLSSLEERERRLRLKEFFEQKIPCILVARGKRALPEICELADEYHVPVMRTKAITKHLINAATIIMENLMAPHMKVQGTMMEIMGVGVLIDGPPGIGKSDTALSLIKQGHALVSDDVTEVRLDSSGSVIAAPVSVTRYHMEIRGLGIIHVPSLYGVASVRHEKRLEMVVTLCSADKREDEYRGGEPGHFRKVLGVHIPQLTIAVTPGRDIANIVEAAALNMKLKRLGHDAEKELDEKLVALMTGSRAVSD